MEAARKMHGQGWTRATVMNDSSSEVNETVVMKEFTKLLCPVSLHFLRYLLSCKPAKSCIPLISYSNTSDSFHRAIDGMKAATG